MNEDGRPEHQRSRGWNAPSFSAIHPRLPVSSQRYNTLDFPRGSRVPKVTPSPLETSVSLDRLLIAPHIQFNDFRVSHFLASLGFWCALFYPSLIKTPNSDGLLHVHIPVDHAIPRSSLCKNSSKISLSVMNSPDLCASLPVQTGNGSEKETRKRQRRLSSKIR